MRLKKMACAFLPKWRNPLTLRERLTKSTIWAGSVVLGLTVIFVVDIDCLSFGILSCKAGFNGHGWFILGLVSQGGVCSNPFMRTQFCWVVLWYSENQAWPYVSYSSPCYGMLSLFMGEILRPHSPSLASEFFHGCQRWTMIFETFATVKKSCEWERTYLRHGPKETKNLFNFSCDKRIADCIRCFSLPFGRKRNYFNKL